MKEEKINFNELKKRFELNKQIIYGKQRQAFLFEYLFHELLFNQSHKKIQIDFQGDNDPHRYTLVRGVRPDAVILD